MPRATGGGVHTSPPSRCPAPARGERLALLVPALALALTAATARHEPPARVLRVCADPNNLPFSNARGEGFENRLAALVARELGAELRYTWHAQRRGFVRETLRARACDLIPGVPTTLESVLATRPYYRSAYVFVQRADAPRRVRSLDDAALRTLRVGVHFIGDDYTNTPPAHALATRGIVRNVVGFSLYGDYREPNPPARLVDAVATGEVDVAIVWGPLAGYFARSRRVPLTVTPVSPLADSPALPFAFDMSMGVRRDDAALRAEVERALTRRRAEVRAILDEFGVPRVAPPP